MADLNIPDVAPELPTLAPGLILSNRYRLESFAGQGGMSVVWRAKDMVLEHETALKFLPTVLSSDRAALIDLRKEARRARDLAHPYICKVYDYGEDPARQLAWISMEYLPGGSLSRQLRDHPRGYFEPDEILPWVTQLCEALEYAHEIAHVIHRDLKPANLLLDAAGAARITDFGIAQTVSESISRLTGATSPTATGRSGTVLYMSPQQARGERPRPTDDFYSLGATIFELLTAQAPFTTGDVAWQREYVPPARVSERRRELYHVEAPIPEAWELLIQRLLAKHASHRPQNTEDVLDALRAATAPKATIPVTPVSTAPPVATPTKKPPTAATPPPIPASAKTPTPPSVVDSPSPPPVHPPAPKASVSIVQSALEFVGNNVWLVALGALLAVMAVLLGFLVNLK